MRERLRLGAVVMATNGVPKVKARVQTPEGEKVKWIAEHRLLMAHQLGRDLEAGEKVFHRDNTLLGEKDYNNPGNLVVVKQRTTKWKKLQRSRVLFRPDKDMDYIPFKPRRVAYQVRDYRAAVRS